MSAEDKSKQRRRKLNEEERALWERITAAVKPLRPRPLDRAAKELPPVKSARPQPARSSVAAAPKRVPELEPLQRRQKQRLARGIEPIDARIDLHGKTQSEAHDTLLRFLRRAQTADAKFVLVITGKGVRTSEGSSEAGVLKRQVPLWLRLPEFRAYVVGFEQAHVGHGGEGALYVRVRRGRAPRA